MKQIRVLIAILVLLAPAALAQGYHDLDTAVASVGRGMERGESDPIVSGVTSQIQLQFPGLMKESGFFGRDQAAYLLDDLFHKAAPVKFEVVSARKVSSQGQYHITANWTIKPTGKEETREVYITLQSRDDRWSVTSIRSSSDR